jgi:hypothetical protein
MRLSYLLALTCFFATACSTLPNHSRDKGHKPATFSPVMERGAIEFNRLNRFQ